MTSSLDIDGKNMHSIRYAAGHSGYSPDYITRLARDEKIVAAQIGRKWFVDLESLSHYSAIAAIEQKLRQQQLSDERKRERQLKDILEVKLEHRVRHHRTLALRAKVLTGGVLALGLLAGFAIEKLPYFSVNRQVASAPLIQQLQGGNVIPPAATATTSIPVGAEVLNFSHESFRLSTLHAPAQGVLLLPVAENASSSLNVEALFSDDVKVLTAGDGQRFLARLDGKGVVVEKIPFVVVPINSEKIP